MGNPAIKMIHQAGRYRLTENPLFVGGTNNADPRQESLVEPGIISQLGMEREGHMPAFLNSNDSLIYGRQYLNSAAGPGNHRSPDEDRVKRTFTKTLKSKIGFK